jgi:hypothetical protein
MIVAVLGLWLADAAYIFANNVRIPASLQELKAAGAQEQAAIVGLAALSVALLLMVLNTYIYNSDPIGRTQEFVNSFRTQEKRRQIRVESMIDQYNDLHDDGKHKVDDRNSSYATLVNAYYGACLCLAGFWIFIERVFFWFERWS